MLSTCKFYSVRQMLMWLLFHTFPTSPMRERKVRTCRLPFFGFDEGCGSGTERECDSTSYISCFDNSAFLSPLFSLHNYTTPLTTADDGCFCLWLFGKERQTERPPTLLRQGLHCAAVSIWIQEKL